MNALNINFFLLPTKFLQSVNLAISTIWPLVNPLAVPARYRSSSFLAYHLLIENHIWLIQLCITSSLESTSWFIPSASPVISRLTSSFTCQLTSVITTLIIHHSRLKPTFSANPSHLNTSALDCLMTMGPDRTYHASQFIFSSFFLLIFLFVPCGGLSWLHVCFVLHVKYTISYSYRIVCCERACWLRVTSPLAGLAVISVPM